MRAMTDSEPVETLRSDEQSWRSWCAEHQEAGWLLDTMTLADHGDHLELLAHLVHDETWQRVIVTFPLSAPVVDSVADIFPAADWCEREIAEMFGVDFSGRTATPPLLLHQHDGPPPLRRTSWLAPRGEKSWPGSSEPGDDGRQGSNPGRRRQRPLGVPS